MNNKESECYQVTERTQRPPNQPVLFVLTDVLFSAVELNVEVGNLFFTPDSIYYIDYASYTTVQLSNTEKDAAFGRAATWRSVEQGLSIGERLKWHDYLSKKEWVDTRGSGLPILTAKKSDIQGVHTDGPKTIRLQLGEKRVTFTVKNGHHPYTDIINAWFTADHANINAPCVVSSNNIPPIMFYISLSDGKEYPENILNEMAGDDQYMKTLHGVFKLLTTDKQVLIAQKVTTLKGKFKDTFISMTKSYGKAEVIKGKLLLIAGSLLVALLVYLIATVKLSKTNVLNMVFFIALPSIVLLLIGASRFKAGRKLKSD